MIEQRLIAPETAGPEDSQESLRPLLLGQYIGQRPVKEQMAIFIGAARKRAESLDHTLIFGPPGLGKTTLARIIANEMGVKIRATAGPVLEKSGDLAALLTNLGAGDVLFIDEIHRLRPAIEEILYPAMEDGQLDIMIGEGPSARSIKLELPPFTLVGATTRAGLLTSPLRDRFGIVQRLDFYAIDELAEIVTRSAGILGVETNEEGAKEIAARSPGTPRIANRLLRRVRDYALVKVFPSIDEQVVAQALAMHRIDPLGLDPSDHRLLRTMAQQFEGGPVGLTTLAAVLGEDPDTIETVLEPYLLQIGFLQRTPRGRRLAPPAYDHLGLIDLRLSPAMDQRLDGQLPIGF